MIPTASGRQPEDHPRPDNAPHVEGLSGADHSQSGQATLPSASAPASEIEIKLLCDPQTLDAVCKAQAILDRHAGPWGETLLEATYFDTPDHALLQRRWALRVRKNKAGEHIMTLKTPGADDASGAFSRNEWNAAVSGNELDRGQLNDWLASNGSVDVAPDALAPVFSTQVKRRSGQLNIGTSVVELAADHGKIIAGERSTPVCEIEIELVSGAPGAIFDLAADLTRSFDMRPAIRSKAARGYDLALDRPAKAVKAEPVSIDPEASFDVALGVALRGMYAHAMDNLDAATLGTSPEGIHQLRVALRRTRSLLGLVYKLNASKALANLRVEAKWLMGELGHARNLDVFATGALQEVQNVCGADVDFSALAKRVDIMRSQAQERARAAITSRRCALFLISLGGWITRSGWREEVVDDVRAQLDAPARDTARAMFQTAYRKVRKRGHGFNRLGAEGLHQTRLSVKKLRYVGEVFQPFLTKAHADRRFAKRLARLQDAFGRFNDLHATGDVLTALRQTGPGKAAVKGTAKATGNSDAIPLSIGAILAWRAMEQSNAIDDLARQWRKFRAVETPTD